MTGSAYGEKGVGPCLFLLYFGLLEAKLISFFFGQEYSTKQLNNLVNVCLGSHINKKARQKLVAAIDDIDRPKR